MRGLYAHTFEVSSGLVDILPRMHKKKVILPFWHSAEKAKIATILLEQ
jgi:hypothetical protein